VEEKSIKTHEISESTAPQPSSLDSNSNSSLSEVIIVKDPELMNLLNQEDIRKIRMGLITGEKTFEELRNVTGLKDDPLKSLLFTLLSKNIIFSEEKTFLDSQTTNIFYYLKAKKFVYQQKEKQIFTNPGVMVHLGHEKKRQLLNLMQSQGCTIMELSKKINMNPGTVKRHLSDLIHTHLVTIEKEEFNERRILLKYYIVVAKKIIFHYEWPSSNFK